MYGSLVETNGLRTVDDELVFICMGAVFVSAEAIHDVFGAIICNARTRC